MFEKKLKPSSTEDFITTNTKKHCFISLQQRLKTVFFILFLIFSSTNRQIDKSANRLIQRCFIKNFFRFFSHFIYSTFYFLPAIVSIKHNYRG